MPKEYQLIVPLSGVETQTVKRIKDNAFIPFDEGNRDYQEYLQWLSEGNEPDPPEAQLVAAPELSPEEEMAMKLANEKETE